MQSTLARVAAVIKCADMYTTLRLWLMISPSLKKEEEDPPEGDEEDEEMPALFSIGQAEAAGHKKTVDNLTNFGGAIFDERMVDAMEKVAHAAKMIKDLMSAAKGWETFLRPLMDDAERLKKRAAHRSDLGEFAKGLFKVGSHAFVFKSAEEIVCAWEASRRGGETNPSFLIMAAKAQAQSRRLPSACVAGLLKRDDDCPDRVRFPGLKRKDDDGYDVSFDNVVSVCASLSEHPLNIRLRSVFAGASVQEHVLELFAQSVHLRHANLACRAQNVLESEESPVDAVRVLLLNEDEDDNAALVEAQAMLRRSKDVGCQPWRATSLMELLEQLLVTAYGRRSDSKICATGAAIFGKIEEGTTNEVSGDLVLKVMSAYTVASIATSLGLWLYKALRSPSPGMLKGLEIRSDVMEALTGFRKTVGGLQRDVSSITSEAASAKVLFRYDLKKLQHWATAMTKAVEIVSLAILLEMANAIHTQTVNVIKEGAPTTLGTLRTPSTISRARRGACLRVAPVST